MQDFYSTFNRINSFTEKHKITLEPHSLKNSLLMQIISRVVKNQIDSEFYKFLESVITFSSNYNPKLNSIILQNASELLQLKRKLETFQHKAKGSFGQFNLANSKDSNSCTSQGSSLNGNDINTKSKPNINNISSNSYSKVKIKDRDNGNKQDGSLNINLFENSNINHHDETLELLKSRETKFELYKENKTDSIDTISLGNSEMNSMQSLKLDLTGLNNVEKPNGMNKKPSYSLHQDNNLKLDQLKQVNQETIKETDESSKNEKSLELSINNLSNKLKTHQKTSNLNNSLDSSLIQDSKSKNNINSKIISKSPGNDKIKLNIQNLSQNNIIKVKKRSESARLREDNQKPSSQSKQSFQLFKESNNRLDQDKQQSESQRKQKRKEITLDTNCLSKLDSNNLEVNEDELNKNNRNAVSSRIENLRQNMIDKLNERLKSDNQSQSVKRNIVEKQRSYDLKDKVKQTNSRLNNSNSSSPNKPIKQNSVLISEKVKNANKTAINNSANKVGLTERNNDVKTRRLNNAQSASNVKIQNNLSNKIEKKSQMKKDSSNESITKSKHQPVSQTIKKIMNRNESFNSNLSNLNKNTPVKHSTSNGNIRNQESSGKKSYKKDHLFINTELDIDDQE